MESNLALVNLSYPVDSELPNLDQFDHMVVHLPSSGRFIDATDKDYQISRGSPRGLQDNFALVLSNAPRLLTIEPPAVQSSIVINRTVDIDADGTATIDEHATFNGYYAAGLRSSFRDIEAVNLPRSMESWLTDEYITAQLTEHEVENVSSLLNHCSIG